MANITYTYTDGNSELHIRSLSEVGEVGRSYNSNNEEVGYYETDMHTHLIGNFVSELQAVLASPDTENIVITTQK